MTTASWTPKFSASSLSSEVPMLPVGVYAGILSNVSVTGKEDKQYFTIRKARQYNRTEQKMEDVIENGEQKYEIAGMLMIETTLISKKAQKLLGRDEPKFFKMININFTDEFQLDEQRNQQFKNLLTVLGLENEEFENYVNFEFDNSIEIPEEIAHIPDAIIMMNSLMYHRELMFVIAEACKDQKVKVSIEKQNQKDGSAINVISNNRGSCGFLSYVEGCENDYIED